MEKTHPVTKSDWTAGAMGICVPGLGQIKRRQYGGGALVFVGVVVPFTWVAMLINQLINNLLLLPRAKPARSILDDGIFEQLGQLGGLPPEISVMIALTMFLHIWSAWMATRPASPAPGGNDSGPETPDAS
jgi:hypothetical protein